MSSGPRKANRERSKAVEQAKETQRRGAVTAEVSGRHHQDPQRRSGNPNIDVCNVCHDRKTEHFDDFYGYLCNICYFKHPLSRTTNPWTGEPLCRSSI